LLISVCHPKREHECKKDKWMPMWFTFFHLFLSANDRTQPRGRERAWAAQEQTQTPVCLLSRDVRSNPMIPATMLTAKQIIPAVQYGIVVGRFSLSNPRNNITRDATNRTTATMLKCFEFIVCLPDFVHRRREASSDNPRLSGLRHCRKGIFGARAFLPVF
jgi:hypothetical protein